MEIVLLTALGVGGATVIGAVLGFLFKAQSHKASDAILSFASGVMLCAATVGLILPAFPTTKTNVWAVIVPVIGIFMGAAVLYLIDRLVPHLHKLSDTEAGVQPSGTSKVLLFVIAIAIHNFPEGIAAGVSFGSGNTAQALAVAGGIALQNIPEGMVIITPMLATGMSKKRTFLIALATGLVEVLGTLVGYFAVSLSVTVLPFALAFAGGTMLYVISDEMIPETHSHGHERLATYALLVGYVVMLVFDFFVG